MYIATFLSKQVMIKHHFIHFQNANLLQAVLHLVKELDGESLEIVADAVRNRLDALWERIIR